MPRTKGSKNRPKTNITKDYATQIAEKQETIASLNAEIASITVRRHIVGGANRTLISVKTPSRSCRIGT